MAAGEERYYRLALRGSVAALCQSLGWQAILGGTSDTLSDIGARYLLTLGRTISDYAAHAERTDPALTDVLQSFNQLGIDTDSLIEYLENVELPELPGPALPPLPLPVPQGKHVHNVTSRKAVCSKKRSGPDKREEGSAGEGEEEESDDDGVIPIHLPPLPIMTKSNEDYDDSESGIHLMNEEDDTAIATPTSIKSPSLPGGIAGLPSYAHLRTLSEADEDTGSRRSSFSDEITPIKTTEVSASVGSATVLNKTTPTQVFPSPPSPPPTSSSPPPTSPSPPPTSSPPPPTFSPPPPTSSSPPASPPTSSPPPASPPISSPPPASPTSSPPPASPPTSSPPPASPPTSSPSPLPISAPVPMVSNVTDSSDPVIPSVQDSKPIKPVPHLLAISTDPPVSESPLPPPQLPPLHLMSPRGSGPLSPVHSLPQLSPLHKNPPTSPFMRSLRPVLHPLSGSHQPHPPDDNSPSHSLVSYPLKTVPVPKTDPLPPLPPSSGDQVTSDTDHVTSKAGPVTSETGHVMTNICKDDDQVTLKDDQKESHEESHVILEEGHVTSEEDHVTSEEDHVTSEDDHVTSDDNHVSLPSPPPPPPPVYAEGEGATVAMETVTMETSRIESDFSFSSSSSPSLTDSIKIPLPSLDDDSKSPLPPSPTVLSSLPSSLPPLPPRPSLVPKPLPSQATPTPPSPQSLPPLPPLPVRLQATPTHSLAPPTMATPWTHVPPSDPISHSFGYSKDKSPLSNQEEEEDEETTDTDTSESLEYPPHPPVPPPVPPPPPPPPSSLLVTSDSSAVVSSPLPILAPPTSSLSPQSHTVSSPRSSVSPRDKQRSLTIRIRKSDLERDPTGKEVLSKGGGASDLIVSSSSYKKVDSILPPPPAPPSLLSSPSRQINPPLLSTNKLSSPITSRGGGGGGDMIVTTAFIKTVDSIEAPPTSLIVKISRKHLKPTRPSVREKLSSSEEEEARDDKNDVKLKISSSILSSATSNLGVKINLRGTDTGGKKRKGKGRGLKRSLDVVDVSESKKKRVMRGGVSSDSSSSSDSSEDDEEEEIMESSFTQKGKKKVPPRTLKREREDKEERSGGLKLRLKLPQQPQAAGSTTTSSASMKSRRSTLRISSTVTPTSGHVKKTTESLSVKSSPFVKVPSINVKKSPSLVITSSSPVLSGGDTGPEVYICPICEKPDDGTPMICCDNCDIWLHMRCVGLVCPPPDNKKWFCPSCSVKKNKKIKKR